MNFDMVAKMLTAGGVAWALLIFLVVSLVILAFRLAKYQSS